MSRFQDELRHELEAREAQGLRRSLRTIPPGTLDLASNDYLGLAQHPTIKQAAAEASLTHGAGARASRLISGHTPIHTELESALAIFKKTEKALVFSSGYAANLAVISSLARDGNAVFCDKRNHASLIDACRMAQSHGAHIRYYGTVEKLHALLQTSKGKNTRRLIITDGVYSMDGDLCDWSRLVELAREFEAVVVLDDAHGTGTLGSTGRGTREFFDIDTSDIDIVEIGTLSKALGSQGGFVVGSVLLMDYFANAARAFIYSTALAPPACGAALEALNLLQNEPARLQQLCDNTTRLVRELQNLGLDARQQPSPIIPVVLGEAATAVQWSQALLEHDVWCPAIRPPTVPRGTSRLRVTASSILQDSDIERAIQAFAAVKRELNA